MIVTPADHLYPLYLPPSKTPRGEGIHISSIIRCIATEAGILKPEWAEELSLVDVREITDPTAIIRINLGLAWEEHYIPMLRDVVDHPGEKRVQGVYSNPDGESCSVIITPTTCAVGLAVHEVKATYKSTKTVGDLTTQTMWLMQLKSYCKVNDTRFAYLHVLFICGDYKMPITPRLMIYLIEFTQEEIDDNWDLLMNYKEYRMKVEGL